MRYIALLRGINVSGQKKIKMADLRTLMESLGLNHVKTYIQSGNVIFDTPRQEDWAGRMEAAIANEFGFAVPVITRKVNELAEIIKNSPFTPPPGDESKYLIALLSSKANPNNMDLFTPYLKEEESLWILEHEIYLHCPEGSGKSKLTNTLIEKKMGCSATMRNWKTIVKLNQLSQENP